MSLFKEESNQIITSPNSNEIGFDLHDKLLEELENINTSANFEREYDEIFEIRNHCLQNSLNQINFEEFLINADNERNLESELTAIIRKKYLEESSKFSITSNFLSSNNNKNNSKYIEYEDMLHQTHLQLKNLQTQRNSFNNSRGDDLSPSSTLHTSSPTSSKRLPLILKKELERESEKDPSYSYIEQLNNVKTEKKVKIITKNSIASTLNKVNSLNTQKNSENNSMKIDETNEFLNTLPPETLKYYGVQTNLDSVPPHWKLIVSNSIKKSKDEANTSTKKRFFIPFKPACWQNSEST